MVDNTRELLNEAQLEHEAEMMNELASTAAWPSPGDNRVKNKPRRKPPTAKHKKSTRKTKQASRRKNR